MRERDSATAPDAPIVHPLTFLRTLQKRKILIAAVWISLSAAAWLIVDALPKVYVAEAVVVVESQRIPETYVAATVSANLQDRINVLKPQILSYPQLVRIIEDYDLYPDMRQNQPMEMVLEQMRKDVKIAMERGMIPGRPGAFKVAYEGEDPVTVASVANAIANLFVAENLRSRESQAEGTAQFLDAQLAEAKQRLEEQERQMSTYKLQHTGELPQQENALLAAVTQLGVRLQGVQDTLNRAQQNRAMLEASLRGAEASLATMTALLPQAAVADGEAPEAATLQPPAPPRESDRLRQELNTLLVRYSERHPAVQRVARKLESAREAEAREDAAGGTPAAAAPPPALAAQTQTMQAVVTMRERIQTLRAQIPLTDQEIKNLEAERQSILSEIAGANARLRNLPVREQQLAAVTRDYESTSSAYSALLEKKMAADVAAEMERRQKAERFVVVDHAREPEMPTKPKVLLLNIAGSGIGLFFALGLAVGLELKKGAVLGEWELPASVPVLGRVPEMIARPAESAADVRSMGGLTQNT